jgi:hypothetical protein
MCYEFEELYQQRRAEEARKALEEEQKRRQARQDVPAKPKPEKAPTQADPVPV